jgi:hypothetical protein
MRLRRLALFIFLWVGGVLAYRFWPEEEITHAPGVLVAEAPEQSPIEDGKSWKYNDYRIAPLAAFNLRARVLHKKNYSSGREAELSPVDLALGWGPMSDQKVLDDILITQRNRWYYWRAKRLPISKEAIISSSANMHMIPANDEVEKILETIQSGHIIRLSGYLVAIKADHGWKWRSSLTRKDTGDGSCEVVWVESAQVE